MSEQKLKDLKAKLEANPDLVARLAEQETPEEAQALLTSEGLSFTREEVVELGELIARTGEGEGELSDSELEGVAGGFVAEAAAVATIVYNSYKIGKALSRIRWRRRW